MGRKRKVAAVAFSLGILQASTAWALGLGELKLESFLNEPLKASVNLLNTSGMHADEIRVRLGTREDFKKLGLDRSFFLTSIEFDVEVDSSGRARIVLSTDEPVLEPYLDFVIEARWPSGRLLREYTVLVDPPTYSDATPVVSASERVEAVEGIPAPQKKKELAASSGTRVDIRKSDLAPGEMPQRDFNASAAGSPAPGERYMIKRDDTLWRIASSAKPEGASVHQTMLDIQRLNPKAFIDNNINQVKAGYIIYLPNSGDISSADMQAALDEVREQNSAWREGRTAELAASSGPSLRISAEPEEEIGSASGLDSDAADQTQSSSEGVATRDSGSPAAAMEERVETLERIVALKDDQIAALQAELAKAQEASGDYSEDPYVDDAGAATPGAADEVGLAATGSDEAVTEEADTDEAGTDDPIAELYRQQEEEPVEATSDIAEEAEEVAKAPAKPKPVTREATAQSGGLLDYIWYIAGAVVLALGGLLIARRRSADEDVDFDSDEDDAFSQVELRDQHIDLEEEQILQEELGATGQAGAEDRYSDADEGVYSADVEAADALAEADIYIAYGRHRQAIDLMESALASEPDNSVYRLKLMEIHTELNDRDAVSEQLHQLRSSGDADSIARAEELLASFDSGEDVPAAPVTEVLTDSSEGNGLAPNPLEMISEADSDLELEFSDLEIEDGEESLPESEDLDLSADFSDEEPEEDELVIAADANGMSTKLDLARAYIDMGDDDGARQILEEVIAEGSDELKAEAESLLERIG